ncbi:unnamed protein product, partial [Meganyctiphanes norvegica]
MSPLLPRSILSRFLHELDQEDLAALLPDVSSGSGHQDGSSVSLDGFADDVVVSQDSDTEEGDDHASEDLPPDDDLPDVILREAINSMAMAGGEDVTFSKFNSGLISDLDVCPPRNMQHSQGHKPSQQHLRALAKSPRADMPSRHRDDVGFSERKRSKGSRHSRQNVPEKELPTTQDDESEPPPMPELEQENYVPIDCNVSNVSPDSGIQSHTGSPMHHIGSPLQHHSPLYASSSTGKSVDSCGSSHQRSFSPTLSSQDSPPPPTLLPAVTPPHILSSPRYDYDSPNSPQMPLLKIQVDLTSHLNEESFKAVTLQEHGSLKKRGPGRPKVKCSEKNRRPRGRPKGSKSKRKIPNSNEEQMEEEKLSDSEKLHNEGEYGIWRSEIINDRVIGDDSSDLISIRPNNTKWNDDISNLDLEDLPPPPEPIPPLKRGPGRPKKVPPVLEPSVPIIDTSAIASSIVQNEHKAEPCAVASANNLSAKLSGATEELSELTYKSRKISKSNKLRSNLKERRPVGRPRKILKEEDIEFSQNVPATAASKKCFSERIMHKIINEKVRNSEKSDKLSVRVEEAGSLAESHRDNNNPYTFQELATSHNISDKWTRKHKHNKRLGKVKNGKQGLVLEENKKKRGRKKELPAIFEKIYGSQEPKPKNKTEIGCLAVVSSKLHSKEKLKKKKKKSKHFRSKHKNIVDPVFLADLEDLTSGLGVCSISKSPPVPQEKQGEILLPSIFRLRKFTLAIKKRKNEKSRTSDRESGTEGDSGKDKFSKRKKKQQELPKQGRERTEANEQRLPLKKRHRHISTAVQPELVKEDIKVIDSVLVKPNERFNVLDKDVSKVEKQDKERNEKLDNKLDKQYILKSSPDSNKTFRNEHRGFKNLEESQKRLGVEAPYNVTSTIYEENHLTVKCTRDDEFLKVHQIIESTRRPSEKEHLNTLQPNISEELSINKKEIVTKVSSDTPISSRTTTTPKKRHRLEASIDLSTSPSSATRATLYLSKGKHDKDSAKPTKDVAGIKDSAKPPKDVAKNMKAKSKPEESKDKSENKSKSSVESLETKSRDVVERDKVSEHSKSLLEQKPDSLVDASIQSMEVKESSGTHSDSDIPSEHEPLCESDQSGFMSDKEGPKIEIPTRIPQKRRKKKRELRSPLPKVADKPTPAEVTEDTELPPPKKKKMKKRKANRTGFPTVKRKKKKPKPVVEESEYFTSEGVDGVVEIAPINIKPVECFESTDHIEESRNYDKDKRTRMSPPLTSELLSASSTEEVFPKKPRPRGRPKKIIITNEHQVTEIIAPKQLRDSLRDRKLLKNETFEEDKTLEEESDKPSLAEILMHVATGIGSRTRRKRDLSEESLKYSSLESKRPRRHGDDEGEECDTIIMSSESMPSSEPPSGDESYRTMTAKRKVPRWKKKYLVAGLFSDYYKDDEPRKRNGEISQPKNKLTYDPEEHRHGLLPPPCYCRKWLREREIDFRLPYDLWWLHEHNMLPGRDVVPSWNYKKVKSNIYFDVRPSQSNAETQPCNCKRPCKPGEKGCGDDCINRMMFLECTTQTCPIADVCSNQPIQRHETINLQRFMTIYKGWGMKSIHFVKSGTFIMEYVGEVVSEKEFKHRMQTKYVNDTHHYCLNLDRGMVIDGHRMGGDCRFVNHSCNPNCEMQKWYVKGEYRMALFSLKDIELGTELTYDYNFSLFNPAEGQECKCGSENCRGVIGGKSQRVNGLMLDDKKKNLKKDIHKKRKRLGTAENE